MVCTDRPKSRGGWSSCRHSRFGSRSLGGFSTIETLLAMGLILAALAMLLPAIQRTREAARRTRCRENLRQMGVAYRSYHENFGCFPSGGGDVNEYWGHSPLVVLLPHVDQAALYNQWDFSAPDAADRGNNSHNAKLVSGMTIPWMLCPSSPLPAMIEPTARQADGWGRQMINQYFAIAGASDTADWMRPQNGPSPATEWAPAGASYYSEEGVITISGFHKMSECINGIGSTILVGELSNRIKNSSGLEQEVRPNADREEGAWFKGGYGRFHGAHTFACLVVNYPINAPVAGQQGVVEGGGFSSYNSPFASAHGGGAHSLFVSGAASFIAEKIDLGVLKRLASREGLPTICCDF